jgi:predicted RND superfamily exporter protein
MRNFLERRDPWGHGMALWVFVGLVFLTPVMLYALKHVHLENDVEAWLPEDDPEARVLAWSRDHFPGGDRILVSWDGSTLDDPRIARFEQELLGTIDDDGVRRGGVPYVGSVLTANELLERMIDHGVSAEEAARRLEGVLIGTGRLKLRLTEAGRAARERTIADLSEIAQQRLGIQLEIHESVLTEQQAGLDAVEMEPVELDEALVDLAAIPEHDLQVSWATMEPGSEEVEQFRTLALGMIGFPTAEEPEGHRLIEDCTFATGSPLAIAVGLSDAGSAELTESVTAIRAAALRSGVAEERLHIGGRPAAAVALKQAVKSVSWNHDASLIAVHRKSILLLSGLVGIGLAFWFLRSLRLGLIVIGVSYYASMMGVALVPLTGNSMNMVLIVMPTLLMVLALSAAIHVANYWKHAALEDARTAVLRAVRMARQPCTLASLTTAIGLLSLLSSSLVPVRHFGIYSAIGCFFALLLSLYGLPALLQISGLQAPAPRESDVGRWERLGRLLCARPGLVTAACLLLLVVGVAGLSRFQTEVKVIRNFPDDSRLVQDYRFLEQNLSGITPVDTIIRFSPESQQRLRFLERMEVVREIEEQIRQRPHITGTMSLADFLPSQSIPGEDARTRDRILFNRRSNETERRIKSGEEDGVDSFLSVADTNVDLLVAGDAGLSASGDELWRISAQSALLSDVDYGSLSTEIDQCVQSVTRYHPGTSHVVTGTGPLFHRTQHAVLESLIRSFGLAFLIIAGIMVWLLRSPSAAVLCMLPNLFPVAFVFGVVSWCGQAVDVGAMITASVALGIAIDGTLHLLTWFRDGIDRGLSRHTAVIEGLKHCGPAMWQTSVAVGLGLLMLAPADILLVSRFGWLMSALIGAALFADVVLLPALLAGPLGAVIERQQAKKDNDRPTSPIPSPHLRGRVAADLEAAQAAD